MKSVLISIRPKRVEKIASGQKPIEVRKTAPQEVPFKAYIYCCKAKPYLYKEANPPFELFLDSELYKGKGYDDRLFSGKVIGEFICDKVDEYNFHNGLTEFNSMGLPSRIYGSYLIFADDYKSMCLSYDEVKNYGKGKTIYGWHISDLKIYDRPKELSEFNAVCRYINEDKSCHFRKVMCPYQQFDYNEDGSINIVECSRVIIRPPQSWMRVEDLGD